MTTTFLLTPTLEHILSWDGINSFGRGMKLICCAPHCIYETGDKNPDIYFERKIEWKGYAECTKCGTQTPLAHLEHTDNIGLKKQYRSHNDTIISECPKCSNPIKVVFTQWVVSKHRKKRHYYYHFECYDRMFI